MEAFNYFVRRANYTDKATRYMGWDDSDGAVVVAVAND